VLLLDRAAVASLGPACARALARVGAKVHVVGESEGVVDGTPGFAREELGTEWEWESTPEVSFALVDGLEDAAALMNRHSPRFVASILASRDGAFEAFYEAVDAPYVGNAFTRWVDGQWAWHRPELGLTNWERGRLLGRSGILSGDDIVTVRDVFLDRTGRAPQRR
jgi:glutamate-5-semialdehyde dehydrogenase